MPAAPVPRYGLRGRVVTMYAARTVLSDGIVWVAEGSISHVTTAGDRPAAHAGSPVIPTAGTIYPGMIELHNHLAYNTLPLFKIPAGTPGGRSGRGRSDTGVTSAVPRA